MQGYRPKGNRTSEGLTPPNCESSVTSIQSTIIKQIVDMNDKDTIEMIKQYAVDYAKGKDHQVQVMFLDKGIIEEVIELGIQEYRRKHGI